MASDMAESGSAVQRYLKRRVDGIRIQRKDFLSEMSGALGDLGTYIPIIISLALVNHLDLGTSLIFNGAFNVITGLMFGVPMPVQPMKSIAAAALSIGKDGKPGLNVAEIMAAGLSVSFILVILGVTGLMTLVNWLVPLPVVRGIQLAQGLSFSLTAVKYILNTQNFAKGKSALNRPWEGMDGRILAIFAFLFVILVSGVGGDYYKRNGKLGDAAEGGHHGPRKEEEEDLEEGEAAVVVKQKKRSSQGLASRLTDRIKALDAKLFPKDKHGASDAVHTTWGSFVVPSAIIIFLVGVVLAFIRRPHIWNTLSVGPSTPQVQHISKSEWKTGFVKGAVPQLPLSVLNSVIAVVKLSNDLFPDHTEVTVMHIATSVGMMNIVGCWFGAMPTCHGCGGLAGQYRFGARSGLSVVILGGIKIALGLLLGNSLIRVLEAFPVGLLGVLLLYAGLELAMSARDMTSRADSFVTLLITAVALQWSNAAYGFLCGMGVAIVFKMRDFDWDLLPGFRNKVSTSVAASASPKQDS